jgi:transposase
MAHRTGILAWYDGHLSTARLEGINNKIKVLKRVAYGYRDEEYFKLRLFALHDSRITRNLG